MVEQLKQTHPDLYPPLKRLSDFFALWSMEKNLADFLESGFLAPHHATLIHQEVCTLMAEIRPDAVGLVDAFDLADNQLVNPSFTFFSFVQTSLWLEFSTWKI